MIIHEVVIEFPVLFLERLTQIINRPAPETDYDSFFFSRGINVNGYSGTISLRNETHKPLNYSIYKDGNYAAEGSLCLYTRSFDEWFILGLRSPNNEEVLALKFVGV